MAGLHYLCRLHYSAPLSSITHGQHLVQVLLLDTRRMISFSVYSSLFSRVGTKEQVIFKSAVGSRVCMHQQR